MSHVVEIKVGVRDPIVIAAAATRLGLDKPFEGTATLFGTSVAGHVVKLKGWNYPVVFNTKTGDAKYDNYGGVWGKQEELDGFLQAYSTEKTKLELRRKGHVVTERQLDNGDIKLTVQVGGAA